MTHIHTEEDVAEDRSALRQTQEPVILLKWTTPDPPGVTMHEMEIPRRDLEVEVLKLYREGINPKDIWYWEKRRIVRIEVASPPWTLASTRGA